MTKSRVSASYQFAIKAEEWLFNNINFFDPFLFHTNVLEHHQTALAELALLVYLAKRSKMIQAGDTIDNIASRLIEICSNPTEISFLNECPYQAYLLPGFIYLALSQPDNIIDKNIITSKIDRFLSLNKASSYWKRIEAIYMYGKLGNHDSHNVISRLFKEYIQSLSNKHITITVRFIYEMTHCIFYSTDFGRKPIPINRKLLDETGGYVSSILEYSINTHNIDLIVECILAFQVAGFKVSTVFNDACNLLESIQTKDGAFSCVNNTVHQIVEQFCDQVEYDFLSHYHPCIVATMTKYTR